MSNKELEDFRVEVRKELIKTDKSLENLEIPNAAIINAMKQNRKPSDVAWALTQ